MLNNALQKDICYCLFFKIFYQHIIFAHYKRLIVQMTHILYLLSSIILMYMAPRIGFNSKRPCILVITLLLVEKPLSCVESKLQCTGDLLSFSKSLLSHHQAKVYLCHLMLLFMFRIKESLKQSFFSFFFEVVFSADITDLAMVNELLHDQICKPCPKCVFLFWSGFPLTRNGLPSPHKSDLYTPLISFYFYSPSFLFPCHASVGI